MAFAAARDNTLLLDLDPQASAAEWKDARADEVPPVMAVPPSPLTKVIEDAAKVCADVVAHLPDNTFTTGKTGVQPTIFPPLVYMAK
jgi:cellulose biosynthesis protein BcsQ